MRPPPYSGQGQIYSDVVWAFRIGSVSSPFFRIRIRGCLDIHVGDINRATCAFLEILRPVIKCAGLDLWGHPRESSRLYYHMMLWQGGANPDSCHGNFYHWRCTSNWWCRPWLMTISFPNSGLTVLYSCCYDHSINPPKNFLLSLKLTINSSAVWWGHAKAR